MVTRIVAILFFCAIASAHGQAPKPAATPSVVFVAHDPDAIVNYKVNPRVVRGMVDRLVLSVTGQPDIGKAWSSLVTPKDKIGIKISAAGGELFTTHHEIVNAIVDGLVAAGHSRGDIIVWDKSLGGIKEAGYAPAVDGYQLRAIAPHDGYDAKAVVSAPLMGKLIWGDFEYKPEPGTTLPLSDTENTSAVSHFSRTLANDVTKIVNVPVMSTLEANGLAGCLYNVTIPNIDNWRRFTMGIGFGAGSIADIYSNPMVGPKVVFNLMDGLLAQYAGGPLSEPNYSVHHATLYASKDPVAIDAVAMKRLEQWRSRSRLPPIGNMGAYVKIAGQMGLGNDAPERIEIKNVGRVPAD